MTRVYAHLCDADSCRAFAIPSLGITGVRPAHTKAAEHYCLDHYPYDRCSACDHPMRPHGALKGDWPGTKAKGGGGLCSTCADQVRKYGKVRGRRQAGGVD